MFFRKKQMSVIILIISCTAACILLFYVRKNSIRTYDSTFFAMDTVASLSISENYNEITKEKLLYLQDIIDCYNEKSEVAKLNKDKSLRCSPELCNMISESAELSRDFGNAVDISAGSLTMLWEKHKENNTLPDDKAIQKAMSSIAGNKIEVSGNNVVIPDNMNLDFGAVGKGYALDYIKTFYDSKNVGFAVVSMNSSVLLYGQKPDNKKFRIQIRNPDNTNDSLGTVQVDECFLSTSGGYERYFEVNGVKYHHILDLNTGYPSDTGLTSVTVFCDSGIMSDFLSTFIFIEGKDKLYKYLDSSEYKIIVADENKNIYVSKGLDFTLNPDCGYSQVINDG